VSESSYAEPAAAEGVPRGPRSGFWRRFGAAFLDGILLAVISGVLTVIFSRNAANGLGTLVSLAYFTYFEGGASGQTLGKRALGIRVIDIKGGGPIGYGRGFIRWIGRFVSAIALFLGYFWMIWDKEKQTWHDKFASSVVVPVSDYPVS
jgi:uncharacterized RDD family membrane protein YckC